MIRRILIFATLVLAGPVHADQPAVELIAKVKPALVGIATHDPLRQPVTELLGTGFAVADGRHVMTAFHVVKGRSRLVALVGSGEDAQMRDVTIVTKDPVNDLALLKIEGSMLPTLPLDGRATAPDGTDVVFVGFPIGAVYGLYPASHRGMIAGLTPVTRPSAGGSALTPDAIALLRANPMVYQLDGTTLPGNSGGPVLDLATGTVIGIVNSSYVQDQKDGPASEVSGIGFAIPVAAAIELLDKAGMKP